MSAAASLKQKLLTAPYPALPAAILLFFVACFALHPASPFFTRTLADPDDYMRLNQVAQWLQGQSWFDLSVPRLSPATHTIVHWSRLIDLPIATLALPLSLTQSLTDALLTAALIVPLLWLALLLKLLPSLARPFVKDTSANLTCLLLLFTPLLLFNFTPGRVDHHGMQVIIAGFGFLGLTKIIRNDHAPLFAALCAAAFSCGFWIGTEALPWAILYIFALAVAAAWQGGRTARAAATFGLCLPLFTAALIPLALPAAEFSSRALSWFSPAYVLFAALSGLIFILGALLPLARPARLVAYALLGFSAATAFFFLVPSALQGPFADYNAFDATIALDHINESQPLLNSLHFNPHMPLTLVPLLRTFARLLLLPLLALATALTFSAKSRGETRLLWLAQSLFLATALALTLFWQLRVGIYMELFALAPLTRLLESGFAQITDNVEDRDQPLAKFLLFFLLAPLPVVVLPAWAHKTPTANIALFPAARTTSTCNLAPLLPLLNDPANLGNRPRTILNTSNSGPQLLFATPHKVIAGNFDVTGNAAAYAFFRATDDAAAQQIAHDQSADLVLLCRNAQTLYVGKDYYSLSHSTLQTGADGQLHFINNDPVQPLIAKLGRGEIPQWLKPIEIPATTDYVLFEILDTAGNK